MLTPDSRDLANQQFCQLKECTQVILMLLSLKLSTDGKEMLAILKTGELLNSRMLRRKCHNQRYLKLQRLSRRKSLIQFPRTSAKSRTFRSHQGGKPFEAGTKVYRRNLTHAHFPTFTLSANQSKGPVSSCCRY